MTAFPKHQYNRDKSLLLACRKIPCQHCGIDDDTVVAAHSNGSKNHKGMGIKADHSAVAALCNRCHMEMDQGRTLSRSERVEMWNSAHESTVIELKRLGIWPELP